MEEYTILKQMQGYLDEDEVIDDSENFELLAKKKQDKIHELEKIRILNRKLLFGLWICKFIKKYNEKKPKIMVKNSPKNEKIIKSLSNWEIFQYIFAISILFIIATCIGLRALIHQNSVI